MKKIITSVLVLVFSPILAAYLEAGQVKLGQNTNSDTCYESLSYNELLEKHCEEM